MKQSLLVCGNKKIIIKKKFNGVELTLWAHAYALREREKYIIYILYETSIVCIIYIKEITLYPWNVSRTQRINIRTSGVTMSGSILKTTYISSNTKLRSYFAVRKKLMLFYVPYICTFAHMWTHGFLHVNIVFIFLFMYWNLVWNKYKNRRNNNIKLERISWLDFVLPICLCLVHVDLDKSYSIQRLLFFCLFPIVNNIYFV